jgi:hypothetical protein
VSLISKRTVTRPRPEPLPSLDRADHARHQLQVATHPRRLLIRFRIICHYILEGILPAECQV